MLPLSPTPFATSVQDFQLTESSLITKSLSEQQEEVILEHELSAHTSKPVDTEFLHMVACGPTYFVGLVSSPASTTKKPSRCSSLGEQGLEAVKLKAALRAEIVKRKELEEKIVTLQTDFESLKQEIAQDTATTHYQEMYEAFVQECGKSQKYSTLLQESEARCTDLRLES